MLLRPAVTRPEPAVSVPKAKGTIPRATTDADPALEPPLMYSGRKVLAQDHRENEGQTGRWQIDPGSSCRQRQRLLPAGDERRSHLAERCMRIRGNRRSSATRRHRY